MPLTPYFLLFAAIGFYIFGRWRDISESTDMFLFGMSEKLVLARDAYGYFVKGKAVFLSALIGLGLTAISLWNIYSAVGALCIAGGYSLIWSFLNAQKKRKARKFQDNFLGTLVQFPDSTNGDLSWLFERIDPLLTAKDRSFYGFFPWVYSTKEIGTTELFISTRGEIRTKLREIASRPQSQWYVV